MSKLPMLSLAASVLRQWYAAMPYDELQRQMASDATLRRDWDPLYGDRIEKLVFIGQHLDGKAIKDALDFCLDDFE